MKYFIFILFVLFSCMSCTQNKYSLYESMKIKRPVNGFDRNQMFSGYGEWIYGDMARMLRQRTHWNRKTDDFRIYFPHCNIEILAFNQTSEDKSFSAAERIMIADALDLLIFAINSSVFAQEMTKRKFYDNDHVHSVPASTVVEILRSKPVKLIIGKSSLGEDVLAEATVDGGVNYVWFRDDTCYSLYSVAYLAMILGHEISHNMGFSHPSNVPYGVHNPILAAISLATLDQVNLFKDVTPYMEDECLYKVRAFSGTEKGDNICCRLNT